MIWLKYFSLHCTLTLRVTNCHLQQKECMIKINGCSITLESKMPYSYHWLYSSWLVVFLYHFILPSWQTNKLKLRLHRCLAIFFPKIAILRNEWKLAVVATDIKEEQPRKSQSPTTSFSRINRGYEVSEETEGRVTKNSAGIQQDRDPHTGCSL